MYEVAGAGILVQFDILGQLPALRHGRQAPVLKPPQVQFAGIFQSLLLAGQSAPTFTQLPHQFGLGVLADAVAEIDKLLVRSHDRGKQTHGEHLEYGAAKK